LAEGFDRSRFVARLGTRHLGRSLLVRESAASTNDDAWAALAELGDGAAVTALAQTRGRGRAGRSWQQVPGKGLALSVALHLGCDVRQAGVIPLAAGLAACQAAHALGAAHARLKWPNDVRVGERKLAGVLCEVRRVAAGAGGAAAEAVVIGVGMNVAHTRNDFPPELRDAATSLALEGSDAARVEDAAAEFLTRLEPLWDEVQEGDRAAVIAAWSALAPHWGERVRVRTPAGDVEGIAQRLDLDGGLVLRTAGGQETTVLAGDVVTAAAGWDAA
jgi:BirA family biotin operon repressor/biotin-[acetyl-CoA-carboxylase] ligase